MGRLGAACFGERVACEPSRLLWCLAQLPLRSSPTISRIETADALFLEYPGDGLKPVRLAGLAEVAAVGHPDCDAGVVRRHGDVVQDRDGGLAHAALDLGQRLCKLVVFNDELHPPVPPLRMFHGLFHGKQRTNCTACNTRSGSRHLMPLAMSWAE